MTFSIRGAARAHPRPRSTCGFTARTVEIFDGGQRVGIHQRGYVGASTARPPNAQLPPTLRRVDAGSVPPSGRQDRA